MSGDHPSYHSMNFVRHLIPGAHCKLESMGSANLSFPQDEIVIPLDTLTPFPFHWVTECDARVLPAPAKAIAGRT